MLPLFPWPPGRESLIVSARASRAASGTAGGLCSQAGSMWPKRPILKLGLLLRRLPARTVLSGGGSEPCPDIDADLPFVQRCARRHLGGPPQGPSATSATFVRPDERFDSHRSKCELPFRISPELSSITQMG